MVDFSSPKRTSRGSRGNGLFVAALVLIGFVAYALLENVIRSPGGDPFGASLTETAPN